MDIEAKLELLLEEIKAIKRDGVAPVAYNKRDAAKALGFSIRKLDRLIAAGALSVCEGDKKMIPRSEIERFARPVSAATRPCRPDGQPKSKPSSKSKRQKKAEQLAAADEIRALARELD